MELQSLISERLVAQTDADSHQLCQLVLQASRFEVFGVGAVAVSIGVAERVLAVIADSEMKFLAVAVEVAVVRIGGVAAVAAGAERSHAQILCSSRRLHSLGLHPLQSQSGHLDLPRRGLHQHRTHRPPIRTGKTRRLPQLAYLLLMPVPVSVPEDRTWQQALLEEVRMIPGAPEGQHSAGVEAAVLFRAGPADDLARSQVLQLQPYVTEFG